MDFRILGPLEVWRDGRQIDLGRGRQRPLLAALLLNANRAVSADELCDVLWGEALPKSANAMLQNYVWRLRTRLGDDRIVTLPHGYALRAEREELDVGRFERLVRDAVNTPPDAPAQRAALLSEALALWRGAPVPELADAGFQAHIARLVERRLVAVEKHVEARLAIGEHAELVGELQAVVREHPLRENLRAQLMLALYRAGRQAEALDAYRDARRTLLADLGIEPSPSLQRLQQAILRQDRALDIPGAEEDGGRPDATTTTAALVTALAVDIPAPGSADGADPPAEMLDLISRAIHGRGGAIANSHAGSIVALFGTGGVQEDDSEQAILAGLAIRDAAGRRGQAVRVGVESGDGTARAVAERLRTAAAPGAVLVGGRAHRLARLSFEFARAAVDGAVSPAYTVQRALARPRKARGIDGLHVALRGRDPEVRALEEALEAAVAGSGRMVVIGGEAGVGKSRLIEELHARARSHPSQPQWLEGRCRASGAGVSYLPYVELLGQFFGWAPEDADREREGALVSSVLELARLGRMPDERVAEVVPLLANLLGVELSSGPAASLAGIPPEQLKNRTFAAVRDLIVALATDRPVVLVLEDFHWADALSVDLTALLMDSIPTHRLLLVCAARPEPAHRWRRLTTLGRNKCGASYLALELTEFSREETLGLLDALLPGADLPGPLRELILTRCQGNPFFLEEIVRSLIDSGAVYAADGDWRARPDAAAREVPNTVQTVILSRVDGLEPRLRDVLETASVVGRSVPRAILAHRAPDVDDLEDALTQLEARGLLYEDRVIPEEEYSFKHVLTQEAIYASLTDERRTSLHREMVGTIEQVYADVLDEHYEQLAFHSDRGADAHTAFEYLRKAGEKARRAYLNAEAIAYFERALARLQDVTGIRAYERAARAAGLREALGDLLQLTGQHRDAIRAFETALARRRTRDPVVAARVDRKIALSHRVQGRADDAHRALARARSALERDGGPSTFESWTERVEIEFEWLMLHYFLGSPMEILDLLPASGPLIEEHGTAVQRVNFLCLRAAAVVRRDRLVGGDEAIAYARDAVTAARECSDLAAAAFARFELGYCLLWAGRIAEAVGELARALSLAERVGDATTEIRCLAYSSLTARMRGDVKEARSFAARTIEKAEPAGMIEYVGYGRANQAWASRRDGDLETAAELGEEAWSLWKQIPAPGYALLVWIPAWPLIAVSLSKNDLPAAFERVRDLLDEDRQPLAGDVADALARALARWEAGDGDTAREALAGAVRLAERDGYA